VGGSNAHWGDLQRDDTETAELWDASAPLPMPGERPRFDAFLKARHIERQDLARTCGRYAPEYGDDVVMWCWVGGAKFRNLESGHRWNTPAFKPPRAHVIEPLDGRTGAVLLVAEGETDAARLHRLYPFAAVAILPLGADYLPSQLPAQCAAFDAVYACQDADTNGDAGAARLAELVPQCVRHRPPETEHHNDWAAWPPDEQPPPLAKPPDACGSIVFEDFAQALKDGVPDPVQIIQNVLYEGAVHWIDAHPGSGKTTLVMHWCHQFMLAGGHVIWLDYEGGLGPSVRRFEAVGLGYATAREQMHYSGFPKDAESSMQQVAAKYPGAMVIFDSASKSLSFSGRDENSNAEVVQWTVKLVRAAKKHGLTVVVIDHITKTGQDSQYARGAGTKEADTDVHWRAIKVTEFDRNNAGVVQLVRKKDREGFFPQAQWFAVGDGAGGLPVTPCDPPTEANPDQPERPPAF
jgi:adenylylsulfate kinase-like enzyme